MMLWFALNIMRPGTDWKKERGGQEGGGRDLRCGVECVCITRACKQRTCAFTFW